MFERFFPDTTVSSTYAIDYEKLYEEGYRGILFDIDNTLVEHGKEATEQAKRLFSRLKKIGYECCLISNNKKAYFDYFIEDKYEAGLVLHGTEVKSIRMGKCSIKEAYIQIQNGEVFINNMNITPYEKGNIFNKDPLRPKKLLLHQSEINKLAGQIAQKGYSIVPLQVYLSKGRVKMEIGLGRGKKLYDKRDSIAKKDQKREAEKEFKVRNLY